MRSTTGLCALLLFAVPAAAQEPPPPPAEAPPPSEPPPSAQPPPQRQSSSVEIQRKGTQQKWPGRFQAGFQPLGFQVAYNDTAVGGYKLALDFAGLVKEWDKVSLWVGGGVNYALDTYICIGVLRCHDIQMWAYAMVTLEKLITKFPIVPFARAGVAGDVLLVPSRLNASGIGGGLGLRLGIGAYYWIIRNLGLGLEVNTTIGFSVFPSVDRGTKFSGHVDGLFGARAAF